MMYTDSKEFRALYPFKWGQVYEWGKAGTPPFIETDGSVWIFAYEKPDDVNTGRYIPLDDLAKARFKKDGMYIPDFGEHFEHYSGNKDMLL